MTQNNEYDDYDEYDNDDYNNKDDYNNDEEQKHDSIYLEDQEEARLEHANRFIMGGQRLNGRRQLGTLLERKIQAVVGKQGFMTMDIITQWKKIVGRDLYEVAKPLKIKFPRNGRSGGVLVIKTLSSAHALTISYQEDTIIEKVNSFFGYKALEKIQIMHGSIDMNQSLSENDQKERRLKQEKYDFHMEQVKKSTKLENIQDEGIKNALMDLYSTIKSKK